MFDLAGLEVKIDASSGITANAVLDSFVTKAGLAEAANNKLALSGKAAAAGNNTAAAAAQAHSAALAKVLGQINANVAALAKTAAETLAVAQAQKVSTAAIGQQTAVLASNTAAIASNSGAALKLSREKVALAAAGRADTASIVANTAATAANTAATAAAAEATALNTRSQRAGTEALRSHNSAVQSFLSIGKQFVGLLTTIGAIAGARIYLKLADDAKNLTSQLRLATAQSGSFAVAQADVLRIAEQTRSGLGETAKLYGNFQSNAAQLGITQAEAARATETVGKAFRISGAASVEASQGTRQLVQALQSGVLRGDEFNTIMEAAPRLSRLFADSLGVTRGELRKMAEDGQLTSKKLTEALTNKRFTDSLDREFAQLPVTFDQAMQQIRNSMTVFIGAFDRGSGISKAIADFAMGGAKDLAELSRSAEQMGKDLRVFFAGVAGAFEEAHKAIMMTYNGLVTLKSGIEGVLGTTFTGWVGRVIDEMNTLASALNPVVQALKFVRGLGEQGANAESARQQAEADKQLAGGFAGRWLDKQAEDYPKLTSVVNAATEAKKKHATAAERLAERLARESESVATLIAGLDRSTDAYANGSVAGQRARIESEAMAKATKSQGDQAAYAAREWRKYIAEQTNGAAEQAATMREEAADRARLNKLVEAGTITSEQAQQQAEISNATRRLTLLQLAAEGEAAQRLALNIAGLTLAMQNNNEERERTRANGITEDLNKEIAASERELELRKQIGAQRAAVLNDFNGDAQVAELEAIETALEKQLNSLHATVEAEDLRKRAGVASSEDLKTALNNQADATVRLAEKQNELVDLEAKFKADARAVAELTANVEALSGAMGNIGGPLGQILGIATSKNPVQSLLGSGGLGTLIGLATPSGAKAYEKQGQIIADNISKVFGISGPFAKTLSSVLQGAATGSMVAGIVGNGSKGSQLGGMIGGALGQEFGKQAIGAISGSALKFLGSAAGPLGAIAGSLIGSVIGGLFKKTPTGSVILGQGGIVGTSGNGGRDATGLGTSVVNSLEQIANALGGTIGNYSVSIGMRGDSYRVDPTGQGRTKESDVLNFGSDAQAAVMAAVKIAIEKGALQGLTDWMQTLIKSGSDLEKQLGKIGTLKSALDEAAQAADPVGYAVKQVNERFDALRAIMDEAGSSTEDRAAIEGLYADQLKKASEQVSKANELAEQRRSLEIQLLSAQGNAIAAVAAAREDEMAALDPSLRALQAQVYEAERMTQQRALEIELMQAQGNSSGALNAQREIERNTIDQSLLYLKEAVWANQDLNAVRQKEAEATEEAARLANSRQQLEVELLQAQGNAVAATALRRKMEVAALNETLRPLQEAIYAAEDAALAQDKLAEAQRNAADAAREQREAMATVTDTILDIQREIAQLDTNPSGREMFKQLDRNSQLFNADPLVKPWLEQLFKAQDAFEANAKAEERVAKFTKERRDLQVQLMELEGKADEALKAQRYEYLAALDPANRALQERVWFLQDEKAAAEAAAEAARIAAEKAREAEAAAKALADQRATLEIRLLQLQGRTAEATALQRERELAAMNESLRPLQMQVWALEDLTEAEKKRTNALQDARNKVTEAYKRERGELTSTIEKLTSLGNSLRGFLADMDEGGSLMDVYAQANAKFNEVMANTRSADSAVSQAAAAALPEAAKAFLAASIDSSKSRKEYLADVAAVRASVTEAIGTNQGAIDIAQASLNNLDLMVKGIAEVDESVLSVRDAIIAFRAAEQAPATIDPLVAAPQADTGSNTPNLAETIASVATAVSNASDGDDAFKAAILSALTDIATVLRKADGNGSIKVTGSGLVGDKPVYTTETAPV